MPYIYICPVFKLLLSLHSVTDKEERTRQQHWQQEYGGYLVDGIFLPGLQIALKLEATARPPKKKGAGIWGILGGYGSSSGEVVVW